MKNKIIIAFLLVLMVLPAMAFDSSKIVVAIIDTGIDTTNQYISSSFLRDDSGKIVGWNFLGDSNNTNNPLSIGKESFRIMQSLHSKYSLIDSSDVLSEQERNEFEKYLFYKKVSGVDLYLSFAKLLHYNYTAFKYMDSVIISQKWPRDMKISDLEKIDYSMIPDSMETPLTQVMTECAKAYYSGKTTWDLAYKSTEEEYFLSIKRIASLGKPESNPRYGIGDNPTNFDNLNYGNSNIMAQPVEHATAVASIIASAHPQAKGVNPGVKLLPIRVVPKGEAFDKDIYSAILYAVECGAKIVIIPQAKYYSSFGEKLNQALLYASKRDVLVVLAAGNSGRNIIAENAVPSAIIDGKQLTNVIRVGALGKDGQRFAKSNFGDVDVYFPGESVAVALKDGSISYLTGTDASSSLVAGVASILRATFPKMPASKIVELIVRMDGNLADLEQIVESYK